MRSLRNSKRTCRRRGQRGAALVESVIVSAMLIIFMAGGLFLHRLYAAQHKAIEQARLAAWSQALRGCQSAVDLNAVWQGTGESAAPLDVDTESTPGFFGSVGHTSGSASETAKADAHSGAGSYTLTATDTVACNEIAQDPKARNVESLIGYITSNVVPSMF